MQDAQGSTTKANEECYRCDAQVPADADVCPRCGRRQYRLCYCGNRIPVNVAECPHCGFDWSGSARVSRRKRRSSRLKPGMLLKNAGIGAGVALLLLGTANILLRYFARAGSGGGDVPAELFAQLDMAIAGVQGILGAWWEYAGRYRGQLLGVGIGLAIGGIIGAGGYLGKIGILKLGRRKRGSRRRTKSNRR